ncbi:MAG: maltotransferase domain-containing protein, partial [Stellaceae bacterium]
LLTEPGAAVAALRRDSGDGIEHAFVLVNRAAHAAQLDADWLLDGLPALTQLEDAGPEGNFAIGLDLHIPAHGVRVLRGRAAAPERNAPALAPRPAALSADWGPKARIVIEAVWPELDGGRFPVKRCLGDRLQVWADIFRDGHDIIAAALLYRTEESDLWREAPMRFFDNDRWVGEAPLAENARYRYTIEAWTDHLASWRSDAMKKRDAGQAIALELIEGGALVAAAMARAEGPDRDLLARLLDALQHGDEGERPRVLFSRLLSGAMARCDDRTDAVRYRHELEVQVDRPRARFGAWYEMMPRSQGREPSRSATFDDCIARLPEIAAMGFDVIYLPPIHPIGRVNRKGSD